jgi:hypothetical protein
VLPIASLTLTLLVLPELRPKLLFEVKDDWDDAGYGVREMESSSPNNRRRSMVDFFDGGGAVLHAFTTSIAYDYVTAGTMFADCPSKRYSPRSSS